MAKAGLLFVGSDDGLVMFSDPGATGRWLRVGHALRDQQILAVWPLFERPDVVLVGGPAGRWRSENGGAAWQHQSEIATEWFDGAKNTPDTVYALTAQGVVQTGDGGQTWAASDAEPPSHNRLQIQLPGRDPVLVTAQGEQIHRSEDNGTTWQEANFDQAWNATTTILVPARYHIDTAFAGNQAGQLAQTTDRGRTWQVIKQNLPPIRAIAAARLQ